MAAPKRPPGETRQAAIDALRARPMVEKELMHAIGVTAPSTVKRLLAQLRDEGLVTRGYVLTGAGLEVK